jgi:hypothetical protein
MWWKLRLLRKEVLEVLRILGRARFDTLN